MPCFGRGSLAAAAWAACLAARPLTARAEGFDCDAEWNTWESDWSDLKKAWCCEHEQRGCPFDCTAGYSRWESGWSDQKKEWCCANQQLGCPASRSAAQTYNCQRGYAERESWSQEQKDWCCHNEQLGCFLPTTTFAPTPATTQAPATQAPAAQAPGAEAPKAAAGPAAVTLPPLATAAPAVFAPVATLPPVTLAPIATVAPIVASTAVPGAAAGTSANRTDPSCFEDLVSWEPLDMPGTQPGQAESATACQQRCAKTEGCTHFSYWSAGKSCHLQDAYAARQTGRLGFVSGPFGCWEDVDQDKYIQKGLTIVQKGYECAELSTLYMPTMGVPKQIQTKDVTDIEAAKECRERCASTEGCEHYSLTFPERLCQLAGAGAHKVTPYINAVSGSPTCGDGDEHEDGGHTKETSAASKTTEPAVESDGGEDLIMKTSLRRGAPASWHLPLTSAAAMLFAAACAAWGAVAVARRARRRQDLIPRSSQPQPATGAYATVEGTTEPLAAAGAEE